MNSHILGFASEPVGKDGQNPPADEDGEIVFCEFDQNVTSEDESDVFFRPRVFGSELARRIHFFCALTCRK